MITGTRYRLTLEISRQQKLANAIERGMTEISTGKRIQAPSDDPVGSARVSDIARMQANMATWKRNLESAASLSTRADDALNSTMAIITRAKELVVAAASATLSVDNRQTIALELRSIAEEVTAIQNSKDPRGEPLFPIGASLEIPVSDGIRITAVDNRASIFDIDTAGGPKNLTDVINDAADAITVADGVARKAATDLALDELDASIRDISTAQGEQGNRGKRIDNLLERLAEYNLSAEEEKSAIESADITEVVAKLQSHQLTLQAAQAAFARINSGTLFDVLR
jgi:flagellar hook-associated protein 3 FlgL